MGKMEENKIWVQIYEKDAISNGLRHLRLYTEGMYLTPDSSLFSEEINKHIVKYYRSTDPAEDITLQKILGASVIRAVNDNPDVYGPKKEQVAYRCAKEFVECLKTSKEHYQATCRIGKYQNKGQKEVEKTLKANEEQNGVVQKAHLIHRVKAVVKKIPVRIMKKSAIGWAVTEATGSVTLGVIAGFADSLYNTVVPPPIRDDIKTNAKQAAGFVKNTAKKVWQKVEQHLDKTEIGTHVKKTLIATGGLIKNVADGIKEVAKDALDIAKTGLETAKKSLSSLFTKAKTFFAK